MLYVIAYIAIGLLIGVLVTVSIMLEPGYGITKKISPWGLVMTIFFWPVALMFSIVLVAGDLISHALRGNRNE